MSKSLVFDLRKDSIPIINYTKEEDEIWNASVNLVLDKIKSKACEEVNYNINKMFNMNVLKINKLTELAELNEFLKKESDFSLLPVSGLLTPRIFLFFLSLRIFTSTQYIRIKDGLYFNGEPDYFHEILGHFPMLANKKFADFSQKIGKASIGASEQIIKELVNIYWFTIEFGLIRQSNKLKVFGAGPISSINELDEFDKGSEVNINYHNLDFEKMQTSYYDYYNPVKNYFIAESMDELNLKIDSYIAKNSPNKRILI